MNQTARAIAYVIDQWHAAGKVVPIEQYRARRWLAKHTRPMGGGDAAA